MMNDGDDNENAGLSDITREDPAPESSSPSPPAVAAPEAAADTEPATGSDGSDDKEVPLTKKIVHAAEVAGIKALQVTNDVASKVTQVSVHAFESTQKAVRRMSQKEGEGDPAPAADGEKAEGDAPAEETSEAAGAEGEEPQKESLWGKVRRASGTAALKAAGAAQAAYRAAEPVGQKVADGAKTAYEKAKPVAETAAQKTSEGASAAWQATKGGTIRAVQRVRSISGAAMGSPAPSEDSIRNASQNADAASTGAEPASSPTPEATESADAADLEPESAAESAEEVETVDPEVSSDLVADEN